MSTSRILRVAALLVLVAGSVAIARAGLSETTTSSQSTTPAPSATPTTTEAEPVESLEPIPVLGQVPDLRGIEAWMNTNVESLDTIRATNDVVIVQFWTFGCRNCKATLENMRGIYADFAGEGLEIVGVHSPEFSYERDPVNIAQALLDLDITWPIALDSEKENFHRWQPGTTGFWPRTYVIDSEGNVRFDHVGEGKYDELRSVVTQLLDEA